MRIVRPCAQLLGCAGPNLAEKKRAGGDGGFGGRMQTRVVYPNVCSYRILSAYQRQVSSGFETYVTEPAYPDGYLPTPKYPGVSVQCSGYCK